MKDISTEATASAAGSVDISKTSAGISWGAVYAQFLQPAAEIGTLSSGISVKREIVAADGKPASLLKVGDRVRVRITVKADRDYDFVEVVDKRSAVDARSIVRQQCPDLGCRRIIIGSGQP